MRALFKIFVWLVGLVLLAIVAAVVIIPLVFDPNDYRDEIGALVKKHTGRELVIAGKIDLSVFPWLGMRLGDVALSNAEGFGPEPFARIGMADVRVKLLPLLRKEVEMETLALHGLELHLGRDEQGRGNWEDLLANAPVDVEEGKKPTTATARPADPLTALAALSLGGIELRDARLVWDDRQAGIRQSVEQLNLAVGAVDLHRPFPVRLDFAVHSSEPDLQGTIQLASQLAVHLQEEKYQLDISRLVADLQGGTLPGGKLRGELSARLQADLAAQTAQVEDLQIDAAGVRLQGRADASKILDMADVQGRLGLAVQEPARLLDALQLDGLPPQAVKGSEIRSDFALSLKGQSLRLDNLLVKLADLVVAGRLQGEKIIDAPQLKGHFEVAEFVPRSLLEKLEIELPEMADPSTLTKAALVMDISADRQQAAVSNLQLDFDESRLSGTISVKNFERPVIRYDLELDGIDADRYLPPSAEEPATPVTPAAAAGAGAAQLPPETLAQLRELDVQGTVRVGKLKAMNLASSDLHATLNAAKGVLRVHPVGARLYEGSYEGDLRLDVRGDEPLIGMNEKLSGVQAGPLLKDFMGKDYITGKASLSARLDARGLDPMDVRNSLNGDVAFSFNDGAVNGFNLAQMIRNAQAVFQKDAPPRDEVQSTDFSAITGTASIVDGLVNNPDLKAESPLFRIEGNGTASLGTEELDYRLRTSIVGTLEGQGGRGLDDLRGMTIPVHIKGTFGKPKFSVELAALLNEKNRQKLEAEKQRAKEKLDTEKEKAQEKLNEKTGEVMEKLDEKAEKASEKLRDKLQKSLKLK